MLSLAVEMSCSVASGSGSIQVSSPWALVASELVVFVPALPTLPPPSVSKLTLADSKFSASSVPFAALAKIRQKISVIQKRISSKEFSWFFNRKV